MDKMLLKDCFHNCLFIEEQEAGLVPYRYTHKQCAFYDVLDYGLIMGPKARMSAGVTLEFDTDALEFTLCWQITGGYPVPATDRGSSIDVYANGILVAQHVITCPWNAAQETVFSLRAGVKRVQVWLPHTYIFALQDILLPAGAMFKTVPQRARKVLMLGDSITQGIGAAYASTGYAMQLARGMEAEAINQSVAAVRFEEDCLDDIGFVPDLITVALGTNDWSYRADKADYDNYALRFLKRLSRLYPGAETVIISPVKRCRGESDLPEERPNLYRESELFAALTALIKPYPQMRCVDGWKLMPHVGGFFMDGLHPNDLGMTWYADGLRKAL